MIGIDESLSDNTLGVEGLELLLRDGLIHLHVFEGSHGDVSSGVEISRSLGVDAAFGLLELVLGELDRREFTRLLTSACRPSRTWFLGR